MRLLDRYNFADMEFTLYFMGYSDAKLSEDPREPARWVFPQTALLEFIHNWGTEADPDFQAQDWQTS